MRAARFRGTEARREGSKVRENRLRKIWQEGGTAVNGWLHVPSSFSAEVMAHAGWDSLTIDMQHGPVDYGRLVPMLQAISTTDTVPVVRVPWNDPGLIMRVLDAGCYAVICPMINTAVTARTGQPSMAARTTPTTQTRPS